MLKNSSDKLVTYITKFAINNNFNNKILRDKCSYNVMQLQEKKTYVKTE